jgi:hypothetical protein
MDNMDKNNGFEWFAGGNAPLLYPTELVMGDFLFEDLSTVSIPQSSPFAATWGQPVSMHLLPDNVHPAPKHILLVWFSMVENEFYAVADELPTEQIEALLAEKNEKTKKPKYNTLVAGMAPYGKVAIWLSGNGITTEVAWLQGKEIDIAMKDFAPHSNLSREEYAKQALAECKEACEKFQKNGLPDPMLFEQYMQKFNYRITTEFENEAKFEGIELNYCNGEFNTLNCGEHTEYAMRAKPSKIVLSWSDGKKRYEGYFWTDEEKLVETFKNSYGNEPQKEGTLIIQVEASSKQFRFFLQTNEAKVEISAEDMQYIVFKNKFEFCRSKNYKKPKGGWRS